MILGVGIDLVQIERIAASVKKDAFLRKVFTAKEIAACDEQANPVEHYAGRFAAKEAFMKAIAKGIRQGVWFNQIEVLNRETGAPYIQVSGEVERTVQDLGVERIHISLSHANGMAVAVVILEG